MESLRSNVLERRLLTRFGKGVLKLLYQNRPVPLGKVLFLRRLSSSKDALVPDFQSITTRGGSLNNSYLASRLANIKLGMWSLTSDTLNFLENQLGMLKPRLILEFGSGLSTACLAKYMQELHGNSNYYVLSIEQDLSFARKTLKLLEEFRLEKCARVIHCPLAQQVICGVNTICYELSDDAKVALVDRHPDFVVIDGPSGDRGIRFGTLPLVLPFLMPGTSFFLDDALRDGELEVAQQWSGLSGIRIDGIYFIGKGVLSGQVNRFN